jgi:hypothetical protein
MGLGHRFCLGLGNGHAAQVHAQPADAAQNAIAALDLPEGDNSLHADRAESSQYPEGQGTEIESAAGRGGAVLERCVFKCHNILPRVP